MSNPSSGRFHVKAQGRTIGPMPLHQLERLLRRGEVDLADSVREDSGRWCLVSELEALFPPEAAVEESMPQPEEAGMRRDGLEPSVPIPAAVPPVLLDTFEEKGRQRVGWVVGGCVAVVVVGVGLFFALASDGDPGGTDVSEAGRDDAIVSVDLADRNPDLKPASGGSENTTAAKSPEKKAATDNSSGGTAADDDSDGDSSRELKSQPDDASGATLKNLPGQDDATSGVAKTQPKPTSSTAKKADSRPATASAPSVSKSEPSVKARQSEPPYTVERFFDLSRGRREIRYRLSLDRLPGSPTSAADITDLALVGVGLTDDLVETESEDGGRSLLVRGTMPTEGDCANESASGLVAVVRFTVDEKGLGCEWASDEDVAKRFLPQLQWCGLSFRVGEEQVHYVGLRKPLELQSPLPRLRYKEYEYRLPLQLDQLSDKAGGQMVIDGGTIESKGKPLCKIVSRKSGNATVSFVLDDVSGFQADRGKVDLLFEKDDDQQRVFLRIRLEPEWETLRDEFRDDRKQLAFANSLAKVAFSTATRSGGKPLVTTSNQDLRSLIEDTLKLELPDSESSPRQLVEFARQVAAGSKKLVKVNDARLKRIEQDEKRLELSRKQLVNAVVHMRLSTRIRYRGSTILIPRLSM